MFGAIKSMWVWLLSVARIPSKHTEDVLKVAAGVVEYVDAAIPVVKQINERLKSAISEDTNWSDRYHQVATFLQFVDPVDADDKEKQREHSAVVVSVYQLPRAELLARVALFLLEKSLPSSPATSVLRLAIEIAYQVYKASR